MDPASVIVGVIAYCWTSFSHRAHQRSKIPHRRVFVMALDVGLWLIGLAFLLCLINAYLHVITFGTGAAMVMICLRSFVAFLQSKQAHIAENG